MITFLIFILGISLIVILTYIAIRFADIIFNGISHAISWFANSISEMLNGTASLSEYIVVTIIVLFIVIMLFSFAIKLLKRY